MPESDFNLHALSLETGNLKSPFNPDQEYRCRDPDRKVGIEHFSIFVNHKSEKWEEERNIH